MPAPRIVFYDGACGLCAASVQWCIRHDPHHRLRYAPLQGQTAKAALGTITEDSVVVLAEGRPLLRSDAVLEIWRTLGPPWRPLAAAARLIPRPLRDAAYRYIAARRKRWLPEACALPTPDTAALFMP